MSKTIPPIPPPFGASSGNTDGPNVNRIDTMPVTTDTINTTTTTNVAQSVVDENLPQLLDSRGGSHVINVRDFDKGISRCKTDKEMWNDLILAHEGPSNARDAKIAALRLKCKTAKEMWNDLILAHEGPSDTRDTKIAALRLKFNAFKSLQGEKVMGTFTRLKCLLNDFENNGVIIPQAEVNAMFDSDSDVKEDQRSSNEFLADLNAEFHERALLASQKRFYKRFGRVGSARKHIDKTKETCFGKSEKGKNDKGKSEKGLIAESFDWDKELVYSKDEGTTRIRAFMAIAKK
ncbi:hypothetical protein Tco_0116495 [Tanacetum coccineum]